MNLSYYFPNSSQKFPDYFKDEDSILFNPAWLSVANGFQNNGGISKYQSFLGYITDGQSNAIRMDNDELIKLHNRLKQPILELIKDRFGSQYRELIRNIAEASLAATESYDPTVNAHIEGYTIFGFSEVRLSKDIYKQMQESIKGSLVNGIGLIIGGGAGKVVKSGAKAVGASARTMERLEKTAVRRLPGSKAQSYADVIGGVGTETAKKGVESAMLNDSTNFFHAIAGSDIQSEGGQTAFKAVDTVTDFVPIVGNVKSAINLGYNMICVGKSYFSYRNAKKTEEVINKQIRALNKEIYSEIRSDFQRFIAYPDLFGELTNEFYFDKWYRIVNQSSRDESKIFRNEEAFCSHYTDWVMRSIFYAIKPLEMIEQARNEEDEALRAKEKISDQLTFHNCNTPLAGTYEDDDMRDMWDIWHDEQSRIMKIRDELEMVYREKQETHEHLKEHGKETISYVAHILNGLRID